ncbi:MAG: hypothetical protein COA94_00930 [Rickettsiales bacterium]|nr:MAG: hypothetical protein COA94_00930 [Rickettsiales bacterium]
MEKSYSDVIKFWFEEIEPIQRWKKDPNFDAMITQKFGHVHTQASKGVLTPWRVNALGALAEIIILDQFSRNIHRDTPAAFANDQLALRLAEDAIEQKYDQELEVSHRSFLYMPFMHSEEQKIHNRAMELFVQDGLEGAYDFEKKHKVIIDRFGRYPHRNEILGRVSTPEEIEFLKQDGSSF